jgi:hypothetical protein
MGEDGTENEEFESNCTVTSTEAGLKMNSNEDVPVAGIVAGCAVALMITSMGVVVCIILAGVYQLKKAKDDPE